jgi:uncharacterized membrane protein YsdA (DUF1294 family)
MTPSDTFKDVLRVLSPAFGLIVGMVVGRILFDHLWQIMAVGAVLGAYFQMRYHELTSAKPFFAAFVWLIAMIVGTPILVFVAVMLDRVL